MNRVSPSELWPRGALVLNKKLAHTDRHVTVLTALRHSLQHA